MDNILDTLKKLSTLENHDEDDEPKVERRTSSDKLTDNLMKSKYKTKHAESYMEKLTRKVEKLGLDDDDFDDIIDSIDSEDEDLELKSQLISMGRKYARANAVTEEEGEIERAFAPQEQKLKDLYNEVSKDVIKIEHDLEMLRGNGYNRNVIKTAELASAKTSLHTTKLSIIKELNSMKKAQFDIKNRASKDSSMAGGDESFASADMIQRIFGMGHDTIVSSVGGRDSAAGDSADIYTYGDDSAAYVDTPENIAGEKMCEEYADAHQDNEGDVYLKYEGKNINVIVEEHQDGTKTLHAEDEEGNVVPDYPIPKDVEELTFEVNERTGTAIDQLQRKYVYRTI